jgi:hypothetical protein
LIDDAPDDMLMIEPPPASTIFGRKARIIRNIDRTLRLKEKSQSSVVVDSTVP